MPDRGPYASSDWEGGEEVAAEAPPEVPREACWSSHDAPLVGRRSLGALAEHAQRRAFSIQVGGGRAFRLRSPFCGA
jgi:hypothetical protein